LASEPSKWSIKAAVEATAFFLWDTTVTLARMGRVGWEIPARKGEKGCKSFSLVRGLQMVLNKYLLA